MDYENTQGNFSAADGKKLFYQGWKKDSGDRNIVLIHGMFEHSGRYGRLLNALKDKNYSVWGMDLRGHGQTPGSRGIVKNFDNLVTDIGDFIQFLEKEHGVKNPLLLGHSLGGLLVLLFASDPSRRSLIRAVVASAPAVSVKLNLQLRIRQFIAKYFLVKFFPHLVLPVGVDASNLSHDKAIVDAYNDDPQVFDRLNVSFAMGVLENGKLLESGDKRVNDLPLYLLHGEADVVTYYKGSEAVHNHSNSSEKVLKLYPGLFHEMFNETTDLAKPVFDEMIDWMESRF